MHLKKGIEFLVLVKFELPVPNFLEAPTLCAPEDGTQRNGTSNRQVFDLVVTAATINMPTIEAMPEIAAVAAIVGPGRMMATIDTASIDAGRAVEKDPRTCIPGFFC